MYNKRLFSTFIIDVYHENSIIWSTINTGARTYVTRTKEITMKIGEISNNLSSLEINLKTILITVNAVDTLICLYIVNVFNL